MRIQRQEHQDFDQDSFYDAFIQDLRNARGHVVLTSPYLRERRVNFLRAELQDCIRRHVRICVLVQRQYVPEEETGASPERQFKIAEALKVAKATELARQLLLEMGVHVTYRRKVHEKVAVIDEDLAWTGSLNVFSHLDTSENMTRWESRSKVDYLVEKYKLDSCEMCPRQLIGPPRGSVADEIRILGDYLEKRREHLNLSQRRIVSTFKISQANLSRIERGVGNPKLKSLSQICRILQCEIRIVPRFLLSAVDQLIAGSVQGTDSIEASSTESSSGKTA